MKTLLLVSVLLTTTVHADVLKVARCAQDIADYKHNGTEGLAYAGSVLEEALSDGADLERLALECRSYVRTNRKTKVSRESQLIALGALKAQLSPNTYFFLRGAVRPLIACTKSASRVHRVCRSATGKSWFETGFHPQARASAVIYRLGHSEVLSGLIVRGPQDYVDDEDLDYIRSLPADFAGAALEELDGELEANYLRLKVYMLPRTTRFMEHYFR